MEGVRDYVAWHLAYDDPHSALSWRLRTAQRHLHAALDERSGPVRVLSACAGDGRDIIDVLHERKDRNRVSATLLEVHPQIVASARERAGGLPGVEVRVADAGTTDAYTDAVPADVVLMIGIFGNITDADLERTVRAARGFCAPGATLLWSRRTAAGDDVNDRVRRWFADSHFTELAYDIVDTGEGAAIGVMRFTGETRRLDPGVRLFTFLR